jgi:hypothetical protein
LRIDRGRFIWELKDKKIGVSVHFIPLHLWISRWRTANTNG